jgi:hypothetical protein
VASTTSGGIPKTAWGRGGSINRQTELDRWSLTPLADGSNTRVLIVQTSHESGGFTAEVRLVVEGALREDGSLTGDDGVCDESGAVFLEETNLEARSR